MKRFCLWFLLGAVLSLGAVEPSGKAVLRHVAETDGVYTIENTVKRNAEVVIPYVLNQKKAAAITFGGEADIQLKDPAHYGVFRIDLEFTDGTKLPWVNIPLKDTAGFQAFSRTYQPAKAVKSLQFYAMLFQPGKASFRKIFVTEGTPKASVTSSVKKLPPEFNAGAEPEKLGKLTEFKRDLCLVTDLTDAVIIPPDTPDGKELAAKINAVLPQPVPVVPASRYDKALKLDKNLIVLGNRHTNTVADHYYLMHKLLLDMYYPGKGGYTVRSLHNPFGDRHNVIFAGGSDDAGTRAAVEQLAKRIREGKGKLGWTQDIKLSPELKPPANANQVPLWEESHGYGSKGYFGWQSLSRNMMTYYMTGDKRYLNEFIRLAFDAKPAELFKIDDESYHNIKDPMLEPYHYRWVMTPILWDLVEESPDLSEADRIRVTAKLYEMLKTRISKRYWFSLAQRGLTPSKCLSDRHVSWETVIVWATAQYFDKYYDCYEGKHAMLLAGNLLWSIDKYSSMKTGSNFWFNTYIQPFFVYAAMARGRNAIGMPTLKHLADGLCAFSDLRPNDWSNNSSSGAFLRLAAHLTQDQSLYRLADNLQVIPGPFRAGFSFLAPQPYPNDFFRDSSGKFYTYRADLQGAYWFRPPFPKEDIIEWMTWREKPEDTGDFLLLCPFAGSASREPFHNFAVRTLRIGDDLLLNGYRSQLELYADGMIPGRDAEYGRVTGKDTVNGDTVVIRGDVVKYSGFDWHRTIVLRKNRWILFYDEVKPLAEYKDIEIVNRLQASGRVCKTGAEFSLAPGVRVKSNDKDLIAKVTPADILAANPGAPKPYMSGYVGFEGVRKGMILNVPFELKKAETGKASLLVGCHYGRRADIRIKLDGKTVVEKFHPIMPDRAIRRVDLGKHDLAAGKHLVTVEVLNVDQAEPDTTIVALNGLEISRKTDKAPENLWTIASSAPGRREQANGTVNFHTYTAGKAPVRFVTLIRPGAPVMEDPAVANLADGSIQLRLPEPAAVKLLPDGFELVEKDRTTVIPDHGKITAGAGKALSAAAALPLQTEIAPVKAPLKQALWEQQPGNGAICHTAAVPGGIAVAQGNAVYVVDQAGQTVKTFKVKALIGNLVYSREGDLLITASKDEEITAFDFSTGKKRWSFTSEMPESLVATSAFYFFKQAIPGVSGLAVFKLDGKTLIFAGSTGTLEILDLNGKLVKRFDQAHGYVHEFAEVPGKGVYCIRHNSGTANVYLVTPDLQSIPVGMANDANGEYVGRYGFGCITHNLIRAAKLRPGEPYKLVSTFNGTMNRLGIWGLNRRIERDVNFGAGSKNMPYGMETLGNGNSMRALEVADLDGDGEQEIILAYNRRIVLIFTPELKLKKLIRLDSTPNVLKAVNGKLIVGCQNGDVLFFDAAGKVLKRAKMSGAVGSLTVNGSRLYVGTARGEFAAFAL